MESVYFGKEPVSIYSYDDPFKSESSPREYYFPDENNRKILINDFLSALFSSAIWDFIILGIFYPICIIALEDLYPVFKFIKVNTFLLYDILIIYVFTFLVLFCIIRNNFRRKVYVKDNGTFYIIKKKVKVNTHRKGLFTSAEAAGEKIHKKYEKHIEWIDRQIENNGIFVKKTLTGCRISDNINDGGTVYSGYNEKALRDEDFSIPDTYFKYSQNEDYYSPNTALKLIYLVIKLALYGGIAGWLLYVGYGKLQVYRNDISEYIESKKEILEPFGYEYNVNPYNLDRQYEYIEFIDTTDTYLNNNIRFYFTVSDKSELVDTSVFFGLDLYYDEDTKELEKLVESVCGGDLPDKEMLERNIEKYLSDEEENQSEYHSNEKVYYSLNVHESYWADYYVSIYLNYRHTDYYLF